MLLSVLRFIRFHGVFHPRELGPSHVADFLTPLAVHAGVSASTRNQALYRVMLRAPLVDLVDVVHAKQPCRLPVVLDRTEVDRIIVAAGGARQLALALLDRSGLRPLECLTLRAKDVGGRKSGKDWP